MKIRVIAAIVALMLAAVPTKLVLAAAAGSNICAGPTCTAGEVGPFMDGISQVCGNLGTCELEDIQFVFENVANYVLGIIGALVLLMYVIGGMYFLASGMPGQEKLREKGKTALKTSTVGLVIVFGAFAFMHTLFGVLQGSGLSGEYYSCGPGDENLGLSCAYNSVCTKYGLCQSICEAASQDADATANLSSATSGVTISHACVETTGGTSTVGGTAAVLPANTTAVCTAGLCPGGTTNQCCAFTHTSN